MKTKIVVGIIVLAAFLLRLYNLAGHNMAGDDALYSLRSIGYMDYVAATNLQSTPVTWFSEPQWWQNLSFHDHPPLVFAVQWIFFKIGGVNLWSARLPFALAGTLAVFFTFLLGRALFNPAVGLFAAAALAVSNYAIFFSRVGFLDGFLALWIILAIYFFVKAGTNATNYFWWAAFSAAGVLTKYTFVFMAPVFLLWLLFFRREAFRERRFYFGLILFFALISPLIVYNAMMWRTRGHFDAALSTALGQRPEDFKGLLRQTNKEFNVFSAAKNAVAGNFSVGFQALLLLGLGLFLHKAYKERRAAESYIVVLLGTFFATLVFSLAGGETRFGAILLPYTALLIGVAVFSPLQYFKGDWVKKALMAVLIFIVIWEFVFTVKNQYLHYAGDYNRLEAYIGDFYKTFAARPVVNLYMEAPQLASYQNGVIYAISRNHPELPPHSRLLVYDDRLAWFPTVWIFERRRLYEAAPIHSLSQFISTIKKRGSGFYTQFGLKDVTFIVPTNEAAQNRFVDSPAEIQVFVADLERKQKPVDKILGVNGQALFKIFRAPLI